MADFHFIRPWWLLATVGLIITLYLLKKHNVNQSGWQKLIPKHLANVLIEGKQSAKGLSLTIPFLIGLLAIVALAGPTWKKLPQPVYQLARGSVLIMDMSYSMYATDISPNRLTRARYKAIDLLEKLNEGEIGLIAYAGDAFTISPLTEDINNIELLLPSLSPDLMPALGSNPYAALALASDMLKNAGHVEGDVYWFTDGIDQEDVQDLTNWVRENPYRLNIMGIGTTAGAPIKLPNGQLLKDDSGAIVVPKLSENLLSTVAAQGKGQYARMVNSNQDIDTIVLPPIKHDAESNNESSQTGDQWQEFGPYLVLLMLPLVLLYFRRGKLLTLVPILFLMTPSKPVYADFWQNLWQTKDQQGQALYNAKDYEKAANTFEDPMWQGSAHYQAGNYQAALDAFSKGHDADALFNQGNALAKLQQFDEALAAYDKALELNPELQDAKENKALVEQLKQQQEQQQNQDNQQNKDQNQQEENNEQQSDQNQQQEQEKNQQQSEDQQEQNKEQQQQAAQDQQKEQEQEQNPEQENQAQEKPEQQPEQQQEQQAKAAKAQQEQEMEQKHQQLLNKVTDDPYLLLRNKMQLEYQKRRQNRTSVGAQKKW
ncbi:VWA domain-containing protein [Thalassotalea sp. PP2-459]|uniref:vWA domain-containing protein n=1 Tax=Thalassotalea sp. PP2-459 TaxID=1742724 RepID=UPI000A5B7E14|nr:VWA domain-containing protein [Thalassotalea sp. PP2-459]